MKMVESYLLSTAKYVLSVFKKCPEIEQNKGPFTSCQIERDCGGPLMVRNCMLHFLRLIDFGMCQVKEIVSLKNKFF
jgi:hypothetical protein